MKIKKSELKKLIENFLLSEEEDKNAEWKSAKDLSPSKKCFDDIFKHESPVPYVYDDKLAMSEATAYKKYGEIIKTPVIQEIIKKRWPVGKMPYPVTSMQSLKGRATIGVGHLIEDQSEFEEFKEYTLFNITHDKDGKPIDQKQFSSANSSVSMQDYLMSKEEVFDLFKKDVIEHTQFKDRIKKPITQAMFDSLTSLAFNSGWEKNRPIQVLINLINQGKYVAAKEKIKTLATTSGGEQMEGIVKRRKEESELFGSQGLDPESKIS